MQNGFSFVNNLQMFSDISICAEIQNAAHKPCCSFYIRKVAQTYLNIIFLSAIKTLTKGDTSRS